MSVGVIIGAAVAYFVIGMLWYSPVLFGNAWMKVSGITKKEIEKAKKKGMAAVMITALIANLVVAFIFDHLLTILGQSGAVAGITLAVLIWLGFIGTNSLNAVLWENKSIQYWLINNGYSVVGLIVMGAILGAF